MLAILYLVSWDSIAFMTVFWLTVRSSNYYPIRPIVDPSVYTVAIPHPVPTWLARLARWKVPQSCSIQEGNTKHSTHNWVVEANPAPIRGYQSGNPGKIPIRKRQHDIQSGGISNPVLWPAQSRPSPKESPEGALENLRPIRRTPQSGF